MASRLLNLPDPPTAIHCFNEYIVPDVYSAIQDKGLRIPDDISITAFDGCLTSSFVRPKLTTVYGPNETMAQTAVDMLLQRVEGNAPAEPQQVQFRTTLMERDSVRDMNI